ARLLARFHIEPENVRIGERVKRGYHQHQFVDAWQRYLGKGSSEPLQRYNADETCTSSTFQIATEKSDVTFQKCEKPAPNGHCSSVAFSERGLEVPQASMDGFVRGGHKCSQCGRMAPISKSTLGRTPQYGFIGPVKPHGWLVT